MQSATELGAELICPAQFLSAEVGAGSVQVRYEQYGTDMTISTKVLVNAAGPWVAKVAATVVPKMKPLAVDNVAGSHIELPGQVVKGCYYLEVESDKKGDCGINKQAVVYSYRTSPLRCSECCVAGTRNWVTTNQK